MSTHSISFLFLLRTIENKLFYLKKIIWLEYMNCLAKIFLQDKQLVIDYFRHLFISVFSRQNCYAIFLPVKFEPRTANLRGFFNLIIATISAKSRF